MIAAERFPVATFDLALCLCTNNSTVLSYKLFMDKESDRAASARLSAVRNLMWPGALIFTATTIFLLAFDGALDYTNRTEFCVSCHSQQIPFEEYKESAHYLNGSGVRAGCADCHVPTQLGPRLLAKLVAARDVYHEFAGTIDTRAKFEARRWHLASRVWVRMRKTDSRECRGCHTYAAMDSLEQDPTARKKHRRAEVDDDTCIECHAGVAHIVPDEPISASHN